MDNQKLLCTTLPNVLQVYTFTLYCSLFISSSQVTIKNPTQWVVTDLPHRVEFLSMAFSFLWERRKTKINMTRQELAQCNKQAARMSSLSLVLSLTCEEVWKFDWENNALFECLLCHEEASDVIPVDVWLLRHNGSCMSKRTMNGGSPNLLIQLCNYDITLGTVLAGF